MICTMKASNSCPDNRLNKHKTFNENSYQSLMLENKCQNVNFSIFEMGYKQTDRQDQEITLFISKFMTYFLFLTKIVTVNMLEKSL